MSFAPIVKWAGGKTKLLPELTKRMPKTYEKYFEPFIGGAALFLALRPKRATIGDANQDLVCMYRSVAFNCDQVIDRLSEMRSTYIGAKDRSVVYYGVRSKFNERAFPLGSPEHAATFIFLNKTCFNGLWRVNRKGQFNVPEGKYANPTIYTIADLTLAASALAKADIAWGGYEETAHDVEKNDFVYFDPPYDPINKTSSFTTYTKDKFGDKEQAALATHATVLRERGAHVMLSNNDTPLIRKLYADWTIDVVQCTRPINSNGGKRGSVDEVIITC